MYKRKQIQNNKNERKTQQNIDWFLGQKSIVFFSIDFFKNQEKSIDFFQVSCFDRKINLDWFFQSWSLWAAAAVALAVVVMEIGIEVLVRGWGNRQGRERERGCVSPVSDWFLTGFWLISDPSVGPLSFGKKSKGRTFEM